MLKEQEPAFSLFQHIVSFPPKGRSKISSTMKGSQREEIRSTFHWNLESTVWVKSLTKLGGSTTLSIDKEYVERRLRLG